MATDPTSSATQPADVASIGAANDSVFQFQPKPVRVLFLNEGAEQVFRQNQQLKNDELWIGTAYDPHDPNADDISVYIRIADPMPVVAELLCSVIGRALGLPVPEPFMVSIHPGCLPGSKLLPSTTTSMAFASLNVGGTSFSQLLRSGESSKAMLRAWEHLIPVATFDEWMANSDRNLSNILFVSNALWIIDHAEAFHG
ncbi:MAG: HipA family kinase, partial [Rhodoferax sp.]|uniref:HipA family kinase n=1 Tax=Rhodoferax sp. TaxID=50421 RepID=UPI003267269C